MLRLSQLYRLWAWSERGLLASIFTVLIGLLGALALEWKARNQLLFKLEGDLLILTILGLLTTLTSIVLATIVNGRVAQRLSQLGFQCEKREDVSHFTPDDWHQINLLEVRQRAEQLSEQTLLRASGPVPGEQLLRPAASAETPEDKLLRAAIN